jgi:hypothetical protein
LEGSPKYIGGEFDCNNNLLTSLAGAPSSVGENFYCFNNPGNFTEQQVRAVFNVKGDVFV